MRKRRNRANVEHAENNRNEDEGDGDGDFDLDSESLSSGKHLNHRRIHEPRSFGGDFDGNGKQSMEA